MTPTATADRTGNLPDVTLRHSPEATLADLDRPFYDEAIQTMPRDQLAELQLERLREIVRRTLERPVPLFKRRLEEAGIGDPRDLTSVADLAAVPTTVKQDLRDSEAAHPPVGDYRGTDLRDNVRIGRSTGTTGTPTHMLWTRHDLLVDYETGARMFWRQGVRPGMIMTHAHPAYLYAGGQMLQGTYQHLGCLPIWVPPPETDELGREALEMWQRVTPDRPFMGFATGRFMELADELGLDHEEVGLDFSKMPPLGKPGEPMGLMTAGAECMPYLGSVCDELEGAHVCEDYAIVQAVDPDTGESLPDGQWGRLVVTTLARDNFMLRYDLEETTKLDRAPCPCGETHLRGWWGGRLSDLIAVQDTTLMLFDVENPLKEIPAVAKPSLEYVVVRPPADRRDQPLRVRVEQGETDADPDPVREQVAQRLADALDVEVTVELLERGTLPRSGYKATRIVEATDPAAAAGD